ncbi:MAG TPA: hypothetical protein PL105_12870 [Caldilineaceae bacterium]|nr:hypothetical protein [Caldilineaceae bacterium]
MRPLPFDVIFKETSVDSLEAQIRNVSDLGAVVIQVSPQDRMEDVVVDWNGSLGRYYALFREGRLTKIDMEWYGMKPTIGQVVDCLGPPEFYHAIYRQDHTRNVQIALWYIDRGVVFDGYAAYTQPDLPRISSGFELGQVSIAMPSRIDELVSDVYSVSYVPNVYAYALRILKPWPGSIEAIEVDSCIENPDLCKVDGP